MQFVAHVAANSQLLQLNHSCSKTVLTFNIDLDWMDREAPATFQMAEIYLYPEIELLWAQAEQGYSPGQLPLQANLEAVAAAQKLLSDVHITEDIAVQHKVGVYHALSWACCR